MTVAVHWWIMENLIGIQSLPQSAPPQREYKGNLSTLASRMAKPWAVKPQSQLSLVSAFGAGQAGLFCRRDMWPSEEVKRTQETDLPRDVDTALLWWGVETPSRIWPSVHNGCNGWTSLLVREQRVSVQPLDTDKGACWVMLELWNLNSDRIPNNG